MLLVAASLPFFTLLLRAPLRKLNGEMEAACASFHGRIGYCLRDLKSGETISLRGDEIFPTASTIKTAVMVEAIREVEEGKHKWSDKHGLPPISGRESSMWSYYFRDNVKLDLDGLVNLMITVSDNTATIITRDWLGTMNVNHRMESLGLTHTKILGNAGPAEPAINQLHKDWGMGMTTPNEMNQLLDLILEEKAACPAGCEKMIRILGHQYWDDWIGSTVPPSIRVANKSGAIDRSRSDTAIVFASRPYILTMYTDTTVDQRWTDDNEGELLLKKLAGLVWQALEPKKPYHLPKGYEKFLPTGGGVEDA